MSSIDYAPAGPVVDAFHKSNAFVRGLMGPVGSSKSSACCVEIFDRACRQAPDSQRRRRTRWAILRNTYPELKSTTIKTWLEWFPMTVMKWDAPISGTIDTWLPDKTRIQIEVYFLALERPEDVDKLGSFEITGAWLNEAREISKGIFDKATERAGRFPPKKVGGPTWRGVIMDTNPPDTEHWWYRLAEKSDPGIVEQMAMVERKMRELGDLGQDESLYEFFRQPGGLIKLPNGDFQPNPKAENIENLDGGYSYYFRQMAGKSDQWIEAQILGGYAIMIDGRPVYPEYNDSLHCREISPIQGKPLLIGLDYGLTPAAVICQLSPRGQLLILDELCAEDMGISQFARDVLKPHLSTQWAGYAFQAVGDPAGNSRAESDEKTCFMELAEQGIPASPAISNDFLKRREAVAKYLTRLTDGKPAVIVSPRCTRIRKGFMGGYCYKRIQVSGDKYRDVPDKNSYSHPHDALQYAALFTQFMDNMSFIKKIEYREKVV